MYAELILGGGLTCKFSICLLGTLTSHQFFMTRSAKLEQLWAAPQWYNIVISCVIWYLFRYAALVNYYFVRARFCAMQHDMQHAYCMRSPFCMHQHAGMRQHAASSACISMHAPCITMQQRMHHHAATSWSWTMQQRMHHHAATSWSCCMSDLGRSLLEYSCSTEVHPVHLSSTY
jgi:hypothetical protein